MKLNKLPKLKGKHKKAKRIGRGYGSGKGGHTTVRGMKGQKARGSVPPRFAGGESSKIVRAPKQKGFKSNKTKPVTVKVKQLSVFKSGSKVTPDKLVEKGVIDSIPSAGVKLLGNGSLSKKLIVEGIQVTKGARKKVEEAGGEIKE